MQKNRCYLRYEDINKVIRGSLRMSGHLLSLERDQNCIIKADSDIIVSYLNISCECRKIAYNERCDSDCYCLVKQLKNKHAKSFKTT